MMHTADEQQALSSAPDPVRLQNDRHAAASRLYDAETALHAARQSRVDAWINAAYSLLHDAIAQYDSASSALALALVP